MVPPEPPEAVMVALPQNVPPPEPVTAAGSAVTVTMSVDMQPDGVVYVMVVVPAVMPVTVPEPLMVPTAAVLLAHVPPLTLLLSARLLPTHTAVPPVMGEVVLTDTIADELQLVAVV